MKLKAVEMGAYIEKQKEIVPMDNIQVARVDIDPLGDAHSLPILGVFDRHPTLGDVVITSGSVQVKT